MPPTPKNKKKTMTKGNENNKEAKQTTANTLKNYGKQRENNKTNGQI